MSLRLFVPVSLLAWTLPASPVAAQQCASGPPTQIGQVTVLDEPCQGGLGNLPNTTCRVLRIECDGIPAIEVELRITEPPQGVPLRGTVLFGIGGSGTGFYADKAGGEDLLADLLQFGFRVVDRKWRTGWFNDPVGVRKQSCRYATLLSWVHDNLHTTGAFCASGNSGGSSEVSYALSTWGADAILDVAVPTGGPPMARLDLLCLGPPFWTNGQCQSVVPPGVMTCGQPQCTTQPDNPVCLSCSPNPTPADLREDSVMHPQAALAYPTTRVHFVVGTEDCSSAVPMAMLFHQAVATEKILEFAPGAPHFVPTTVEGRAAITRAILAGAACTSGPAALSVPVWPQVGGPLAFEVTGPPSGSFSVMVSLSSGMLEVPGLGWFFLGSPYFGVGAGVLDATGRATLTLNVPDNSELQGLTVYSQAQIGSCLSNLMPFKILP